MSEAKWTPGPWFSEVEKGPRTSWELRANLGVWAKAKYDTATEINDPDVEPANEAWVCGLWGQISDEDRANSRLIAAAPELYEALAELVHRTPFVPSSGGVTLTISFEQMERQRAALRKARGEE